MMKNSILLLLVIFNSFHVNSQSFSNLKEYKKYGHVLYNPDLTTLINKVVNDDGYIVYRLMKTKINKNSSHYYLIEFDEGPSYDPAYNIYLLQENDKYINIGYINAEELVIPGNGFLYSAGEANQLYNKKQKFKIVNNKITEIKQGAYYIGLTTQTNKPIILYSDKKKTTKIASLPSGYNIEVLIEQDNWFLIKTPYGLTGWIFKNDINTYDISGENLTIKNFLFKGD